MLAQHDFQLRRPPPCGCCQRPSLCVLLGAGRALLQVVDTETGEFKEDEVRTSSGFFLKRGQDDIVKRLEQRISEWTRLPVENGEPLHVLRYQVLC